MPERSMSPETPPPASQPRPEQVESGRQGKQTTRGTGGQGRARAPGHRGALPEGTATGGRAQAGENVRKAHSPPDRVAAQRLLQAVEEHEVSERGHRRAGDLGGPGVRPESAGAGAGRALGARGRRRWALLRPRGARGARVSAGARAPRAALSQVGRQPGGGPGPGAARDGGGGAAPRGAPAGAGAGAGQAGGGRGPGSELAGGRGARPSRGRGERGGAGACGGARVRRLRGLRGAGRAAGPAAAGQRLQSPQVSPPLPGRAPSGLLDGSCGLEPRAPCGTRCPAADPAPASSRALPLALRCLGCGPISSMPLLGGRSSEAGLLELRLAALLGAGPMASGQDRARPAWGQLLGGHLGCSHVSEGHYWQTVQLCLGSRC